MSWRPAAAFSLLLVLLLPFYLLVDRQYAHQVKVETEQKANIIGLSSIDAVTITRGTETVTFQKTPDGKLYQVTVPAGAFVPQDLMTAMTALLVKSQEVDVVSASTDDLSQYGLDRPLEQIELKAPGKPAPVKIIFGNENPTRTAIYAKVEGAPQVFLLGMDLKYYVDLAFEWVEGKQGKQKTA